MARPRRTLLVLGGSSDQLFLIRTAQQMGLAVLCLDRDPEAPGLQEADEAAAVSTRDVPAILEFLEERLADGESLHGVLTMGSDVPAVVAAVATDTVDAVGTRVTGVGPRDAKVAASSGMAPPVVLARTPRARATVAPGGGGVGGVPISFSSTQAPRSTGEVRSPYEVRSNTAALPSRPWRTGSLSSVRRNCGP